MPASDTSMLERRIGEMESRLAGYRIVLGVVVVLFPLLFLVSPLDAVSRSRESQRFALMDEDENLKAEFTLDREKAPVLQFYDSKGAVRSLFTVVSDSIPMICFYGTGGALRLTLALDARGNPTTQFLDRNSRPRLINAFDDKGKPTVQLLDDSTHVRTSVGIAGPASPAVGVYSETGVLVNKIP
jgi:hypothetical protein